ncbi:hypothetical protein DUNSADRAFT_18046 [Dunaliella salina]|uniref:DNA-directed DNA polymerase X domain-containing protein n=1 Tax=Dunaliella salina TaxID=3046 RepID=A0ABQ7GZG7_DUNSA|nr:hypothetical protein DUNSADRAFT_18046 [Dunaliella salina]|eukprot:KAF5840009.1 hypothetical protein DUNSADRAFT_18046 [Dunaliella salina]
MSTDPAAQAHALSPRGSGEGKSRKRTPPPEQSNCVTRSTPASPFSGSAAKAQRQASPQCSPRQQAPAHGQVFHGCHFFSFIPTHMQTQFQKIRERGGTIDKALSARSTTHIISRPDISLLRLQEKLQAHGIAPPQPTPSASTPGSTLPGLPFHFVTQDFVGRSILSCKREDEALHTPAAVKQFQRQCHELLHQPFPSAPLTPPAEARRLLNRGVDGEAAAPSPGGTQPPPRKPLAVTAAAPNADEAATPASPPAAPRARRYILPPPEEVCADPHENWGVGGKWIEPYDEAAALETIRLLRRRWFRQDSEDIQQEAAQLKAQPALGPGPSSASQTTPVGLSIHQALFRPPLYTRPRAHAFASAPSSVTVGDTETGSQGAGQQPQGQQHELQGGLQGEQGSSSAAANRVCEHVCCQARPFCILDELKATQDLYNEANDPGSFKRKAILNALHKLSELEHPLTCIDDVKATGLTGKTLSKVTEIFQTGQLLRSEVWKSDPKNAAMQAFDDVWGVGHTTARAWADAGCRTLDDVRACVQEHKASGSSHKSCFRLTAQQQIGLQYAEDFVKPITRQQIAHVETTVKSSVVEALHKITGLSKDILTDDHRSGALHVRAMGSYIRGAKVFNDVDFIVAPPSIVTDEQAVKALGGHSSLPNHGVLMLEVLHQLYRISALACGVEDTINRHTFDIEEPVTFMGVWSPHGPVDIDHFFRIDIKIYPRTSLPFAVCYFASGVSFNRALRFWCDKPRPALREYVQSMFPGANRLHLSDLRLDLQRRLSRDEEEVVGHLHSFTCESDIFSALGLSYVPPTMRSLI